MSIGASSSVSASAPSGVSTGVAGGVSTSTAAGAGGQGVPPAVTPLWCSGRANKGVLLCMSPRRVAHEGGVFHTRRWQVTVVSTWCCHNTVVGVCHQQQEDWLQRSQGLQHHLCVTLLVCVLQRELAADTMTISNEWLINPCCRVWHEVANSRQGCCVARSMAAQPTSGSGTWLYSCTARQCLYSGSTLQVVSHCACGKQQRVCCSILLVLVR